MRDETTVGMIMNGLKNIKDQNLTPEQMQTIHLSNISIMLAALDDDMKKLINVLAGEEEKRMNKLNVETIKALSSINRFCNSRANCEACDFYINEQCWFNTPVTDWDVDNLYSVVKKYRKNEKES